ncbi:hypothetical protein [Geothrix sp. 21YS21S-4]|nr:hypothetical protein [Geothrix sp. 21YS21S-4]
MFEPFHPSPLPDSPPPGGMSGLALRAGIALVALALLWMLLD